jgi:hypothetical protein
VHAHDLSEGFINLALRCPALCMFRKLGGISMAAQMPSGWSSYFIGSPPLQSVSGTYAPRRKMVRFKEIRL